MANKGFTLIELLVVVAIFINFVIYRKIIAYDKNCKIVINFKKMRCKF